MQKKTGKHNVRTGEVLNGRWRILKKLGHGGMGAVYEAEHVTNGRRAAIKVLLPAYAKDKLARELFQREGRLSNEVEMAIHASVGKAAGPAEIYDSGTLRDGSPYMVMELLTGETAEARAEKRGGKLSLKDTASIMDETLRTIESAHKKGIIHRDIKPANLFLTSGGDVRLLDFGLAKKRGKRDYLPGSGTPGFMAPEQTRGEVVGPPADVYGVGATGFRLLTGEMPPPANKTWSRDPHVRSVNQAVPSRVASVVDKAIAIQAKDRYSTARAMREDLEGAIARLAAGGNAEAKKLLQDIVDAQRTNPARGGGGARTAHEAAFLEAVRAFEGASTPAERREAAARLRRIATIIDQETRRRR